MSKKILAGTCVIISLLSLAAIFFLDKEATHTPLSLQHQYDIAAIEPMPIVQNHPTAYLAYGGAPYEDRSEQFRRWISTGLKISVSSASGSGTIVYHDPESGWAYVQSCGHLWSGNMTAAQGQQKKPTCKVITWYHNDEKLGEPKTYPAEVLFYFNTRGKDCSLLRFKPDWVPNYIPIAPSDYAYEAGSRLHSVGCDGGREVAHYDVRVIGMHEPDLVTTENSPRPGRSGGGLMSNDFYVGICWGTTDRSGNGNGLFTPLPVLRRLNEENGFGWLNDVGASVARQLPIVDRNNPQGTYPKDYIPLPNGR